MINSEKTELASLRNSSISSCLGLGNKRHMILLLILSSFSLSLSIYIDIMNPKINLKKEVVNLIVELKREESKLLINTLMSFKLLVNVSSSLSTIRGFK
ncbi:hypothetical protein D3C76_987760 [compost metagenome]